MSSVSLPRHVHRVESRGREYFYYQEGRGTAQKGPRIRLPNNPQTPEFWNAVRQAQGTFGPTPTDTIGALIDAFEVSWQTRQRKISAGTQTSTGETSSLPVRPGATYQRASYAQNTWMR